MKGKELLLKRRMQQMDHLPTLTASTMQILQLLRNDEVSQSELHAALSRDPSICTEMLRMVNSGLYGVSKKMSDVGQAITLLGLRKIRSLVLSVSVMSMISGKEKDVFLHSYTCGMLMQGLIKTNGLKVAEDVEVMTLVHDIGRVLLMEFSRASYRAVLELAERETMPIEDAERRLMQVSHDVAGEWLLEMWEIPESVRIPVSLHHQQGVVPEEYVLEAALLQIVDYVDLRARHVPCTPPCRSLMDAAGMESGVCDALVPYQEELIAKVDASNPLASAGMERNKANEKKLRLR